MRKTRTHGGAAVEFALILPFISTLIIGTLIYGTQIVKELELTQVARDTASMYARSTDFTNAANQAIVARLGQELGWPSTGLTATSPGVLYLSKIMYIDNTCNGITPPAGKTCNKNKWVFLNAISFGKTSLRGSNYGSPPPSCGSSCYVNHSNGDLNLDDSMYNSNAVVSNFNLLGTPASGANGFQPGQPAYLVEAAAPTGPWNGGSISYAFAMF